ncbi:FKBP-type peptidyl-prolyl cis-trans isomerase [Sphingobacterium thalpophilum]|uniref:FKBP-type peptidyl-prolyl cis-trans isomerase n=1 Tax=Sphingobacterium thalpophilum TaxID=259 RepID=UPI0037D9F835
MDQVIINVKRTSIIGKEVTDVSSSSAPITVRINDLITGQMQGLLRMNVGSKYRFYIPPKLGYPKAIGKGLIIILENELLGIVK